MKIRKHGYKHLGIRFCRDKLIITGFCYDVTFEFPWSIQGEYGFSYGDGLLELMYNQNVSYHEAPWGCYKLVRHDLIHNSPVLFLIAPNIRVETRIEELEWRRGCKLFSWVKYISRPKIKRILMITFPWGDASIELQFPEESHEAAFRRYCARNHLTYEGKYHNKRFLTEDK